MILVTGASGLLGASVLLHARDSGREVAGLCHSHGLRVPGARIIKVDLTDCASAKAVVAELHPESIIHCAASTRVDWCEDHPAETEQINVRAAACLAEMAAEGKAKFVYVSTDSVYDGTRGNYAESDEPRPLSVYAKSKLRGEQEVLRRHAGALVVRVTIYGWNAQAKLSLAEWILAQLSAGKQAPGFTDVAFSPMLANDLAEVLVTMLDRDLTGIYHVVGSEKTSKYEFARALAKTFGMDAAGVVPARSVEASLRAPRPKDLSLSTEKVQAALGRPMPDVQAGLDHFKALSDRGYPGELKGYLAGAGE